MRCLRCKKDNDRVVDSRASADGTVIRRRRECLECFLRYTTYERIEDTPLRVIKKSGERVRFDRERILAGMVKACEKLPISMEELEAATARIEARCQEEYDREVESSVIGSLVMEELRQLNQVAYVRFASVYREFKDVSQFLETLQPMLESNTDAPRALPALPPNAPPSALLRGPDVDAARRERDR
ncbi:MAG: transcriptional regulator NrdR [Planctomycetota bacterium]